MIGAGTREETRGAYCEISIIVKMDEIKTELERLLDQQQELQQQYELVKKVQHTQQTCFSSIKLPELEIPVFGGDKLKWAEFWDFFKVAVDQNIYLSDIEKLLYLKSKLTGVAKNAISGISVSNETYSDVKAFLKERFEDTQFVLNWHYMELINLTPANNNSKGLRLLYDKLEGHLRSLEALQQDLNHDIFISIITSKLPRDVLLQLQIQKGGRNKWSVKQLRELLSNYICATERANQQSYLETTENKNGSLLRKSTGEGTSLRYNQNKHRHLILQCRYCDGNHWSDQCVEYSTCQERKQMIKGSCFLCLKHGHIAHKCLLLKTCIYCGRKNHHHRSLCPKQFTDRKFICLNNRGSQNVFNDFRMTEAKQKFKTETPRNLDQSDKANGKQKNDVEFNSIKSVQHELSQIKSGLSEFTTMVSEINDKFTNLQKEQANNQMVINGLSEIIKHLKQETAKRREMESLQLNFTELNNKLLSMTEELTMLQLENKELETQIRDISASVKTTYKMSEKEMETSNLKSNVNNDIVDGLSRRTHNNNDKITGLKREQTLGRLLPKIRQRGYSNETLDFEDKSSSLEDISAFLRGRFHRQLKDDWQMFFPLRWECRGNSTKFH
ncbi:MAG: DUF1759 domain-containing protein [Candidatus Thiodiazotropha sp.]